MKKSLSILLIDDNESQLEVLSGFIKKLGYNVFAALNGNLGIDIVKNNFLDIVMTDFKMPGLNGIEVLHKVKKINPEIEVILMTAFGTIEDSVEAMKNGAWDYLTKPINLEELKIKLEKLNGYKKLLNENEILQQQIYKANPDFEIIYKSEKMRTVINLISRVSNSSASVLITGESGTGKEVIAKAIHNASLRSSHTFNPVNCAAIPESLFESEFLDQKKGAYTGAIKRRHGHFEVADKGTLFLDEVADIPLNFQVKLLRAIQEKEFQRLGSSQFISVDIRIISATNRNIEEMVRLGEFRTDLFFRLNVIPIEIPPLRERKEDIPLLVNHFIQKYAKLNKIEQYNISKEALDALMKYDFPGNVRELENIIERAIILSRENTITCDDIALKMEDKTSCSNSLLLEDQVAALEKKMISEMLQEKNGNKTAAAKELGISERVIRYKIKKYGI